MMTTLQMAFNVFTNAERALCAADLQVRLPAPYTNPHLLLRALAAQGCIAEAFKAGNEKFFIAVENAPAPAVPDEARTIAATQAALRIRQKHKFAMLAREARRRG